ncbi:MULTISPECIES: N-acetyltransferase [Haloferax]|uniref:GNAT family N-acetyltransferase n=1 Tax=Haloferax marinum TaxID=2666143 RepID=A0A6A8GCQ1_9EURY|nr:MULTISPECIES: GNAT family N-acetyltransferase [Haloferax]KAB1198842.1 GNAT family N-acetyltransferase [Haloferax sp. CBA1150]MRW97963.1 GNAT family N-acetyltransferase [Haloferax marinum]
MRVSVAEMSALDTLSDLWVELANGQRAFGSHLFAGANRTPIRVSLARHITFDGVLVAHDESDDIVGFVMFEVESGTYEQDVTRGTVSNLFVVPERRGEGVGSRLLSAAEERLRDAGAEVVGLDVMAANESARRFYRRHGYRPHRIELEKSIQNDTHSKEDR